MLKKKKRDMKTQLIVTSLVLTCFLSSFSFVCAASSVQYFNFTHGQVTQAVDYGASENINYLSVVFDDYYTGTVKFNWSYSSTSISHNMNNWTLVVYGAKIDNYTNNSGQLIFHVYNQKSFDFVLYNGDPANNYQGFFIFTNVTSSLTKVTDPIATDVDSIDTKLTTTNSTLSTLSSRLQTSNNTLVDILGNTNDIESYLALENNGVNDTDVELLLNSIKTTQTAAATNIADCETALNTIKNTMNTVRTLLGNINLDDPDQMSIIDAVNTIANAQTNMESKLNTISGQLTSMASTLNSISTTLTSLLNTVQNIDILIDTISWNRLSINYLGASTDGSTYDLNAGNKSKDYFYDFDTITINNYSTDIIHIRIPLYLNDFNVNYINLTNSSITDGSNYQLLYSNYGRRYSDLYFMPSNSSNVTRLINGNVKLRIKTNYITYQFNNVDYAFIETLSSSDIEYWKLLSYFDQVKQYSTVNRFDQQLYSRLGDIITAINNISMNVNITDQQVENITENFDQDINTIHNIENDYGLNFDGWDDQITSNDVNFNLTDYNSAISLIKANITSLWSSPLISLPILVSCLCFIFLVILG